MAHGSTRNNRQPITPENYQHEVDRLKSFAAGWPLNGEVNPEQLARVGFVYTGEGALVQCFQCGVKVHWSPSYSPVDAYKRHYFSCPYIQTVPDRLPDRSRVSLHKSRYRNDRDEQYYSNLSLHEALLPLMQTSKLTSPPALQPSSLSKSVPIQATVSPPNEATSESDVNCSPFVQSPNSFNIEVRSDRIEHSPRPCTDTGSQPVMSEYAICQDTSSTNMAICSTNPLVCTWKGDYPPYLLVSQSQQSRQYCNYPSEQSVTSGPATLVLYSERYLSLRLDGDGRGASQMVDDYNSFDVSERLDVIPNQHYNNYYLCRVCWEVLINTILLPCQHVAMCTHCAFRAWDSTRRCPFCSHCIDKIERAILL